MEDPIHRFSSNIRRQINRQLKNKNLTKGGSTFEILGYTPQDLSNYLSKWFSKPCEICDEVIISNSPKNYHTDHIIPIASSASYEDVIRLNQLVNLRLICKKCNQKKNKFDKIYIKEHKNE